MGSTHAENKPNSFTSSGLVPSAVAPSTPVVLAANAPQINLSSSANSLQSVPAQHNVSVHAPHLSTHPHLAAAYPQVYPMHFYTAQPQASGAAPTAGTMLASAASTNMTGAMLANAVAQPNSAGPAGNPAAMSNTVLSSAGQPQTLIFPAGQHAAAAAMMNNRQFPICADWAMFACQLSKKVEKHNAQALHQYNEIKRRKVADYSCVALSEDEMDIYGFSPCDDSLTLVICTHCSKAVKASRFVSHLERCSKSPSTATQAATTKAPAKAAARRKAENNNSNQWEPASTQSGVVGASELNKPADPATTGTKKRKDNESERKVSKKKEAKEPKKKKAPTIKDERQIRIDTILEGLQCSSSDKLHAKGKNGAKRPDGLYVGLPNLEDDARINILIEEAAKSITVPLATRTYTRRNKYRNTLCIVPVANGAMAGTHAAPNKNMAMEATASAAQRNNNLKNNNAPISNATRTFAYPMASVSSHSLYHQQPLQVGSPRRTDGAAGIFISATPQNANALAGQAVLHQQASGQAAVLHQTGINVVAVSPGTIPNSPHLSHTVVANDSSAYPAQRLYIPFSASASMQAPPQHQNSRPIIL